MFEYDRLALDIAAVSLLPKNEVSEHELVELRPVASLLFRSILIVNMFSLPLWMNQVAAKLANSAWKSRKSFSLNGFPLRQRLFHPVAHLRVMDLPGGHRSPVQLEEIFLAVRFLLVVNPPSLVLGLSLDVHVQKTFVEEAEQPADPYKPKATVSVCCLLTFLVWNC